jgi:hypothetical protein
MIRAAASDWSCGVGQLPELPPPCQPWPDCWQQFVPPVSVGVSVGQQPAPKEERSAGDIVWAVLLGATPVIIAGVVVHYLTREKPPKEQV